MSIIRIGLSETKHFADGYDAIFGKKTRTQAKKKPRKARVSTPARKKTRKKK